MDKHTRSLLSDMLAYAKDACAFMEGTSADALRDDRMRQFALIRAVEIIGEAAPRIAPEAREAMPQLPWRSMIGMRNVLIYGYAELRLDLIAEAVERDIPDLISQLETLLEGEP